ncbi:MAG: SRPBCC family protein [Bacteroidales bacterium]|nr:SRPBCC family protein [Bacteroidales bacterium]
MNITLLILLALAILIATPFIMAIFLKKDYLVEREIIINRPKQEVFDYIKFLKNQNEWSKWATTDPNMKATYSGTDGTVGFTYTWDSDNKTVGKGMQELTKITDGEYIGYIEWDFRFAGKPHTICYWTTEAVSENVTRMKWGFTGRVNYPMNFMILFFEKLIGDGTLAPELTNLKTKMEL